MVTYAPHTTVPKPSFARAIYTRDWFLWGKGRAIEGYYWNMYTMRVCCYQTPFGITIIRWPGALIPYPGDFNLGSQNNICS